MLVWIQSSRTTLTPSKRAIIRTWRRRGWTCSGRPWAPPWLTNLIKNVQHYYTAFLGRAEAIPDTWQDVLLDYSHGSCQLCCLLKSFKRNFCFRVSHHMLVLFETPYERYETLWSLQRAPASPPQFSSCVDPPFNIHSGSTRWCWCYSSFLMLDIIDSAAFRMMTQSQVETVGSYYGKQQLHYMVLGLAEVTRMSGYDRDSKVFSTDGHLF